MSSIIWPIYYIPAIIRVYINYRKNVYLKSNEIKDKLHFFTPLSILFGVITLFALFALSNVGYSHLSTTDIILFVINFLLFLGVSIVSTYYFSLFVFFDDHIYTDLYKINYGKITEIKEKKILFFYKVNILYKDKIEIFFSSKNNLKKLRALLQK